MAKDKRSKDKRPLEGGSEPQQPRDEVRREESVSGAHPGQQPQNRPPVPPGFDPYACGLAVGAHGDWVVADRALFDKKLAEYDRLAEEERQRQEEVQRQRQEGEAQRQKIIQHQQAKSAKKISRTSAVSSIVEERNRIANENLAAIASRQQEAERDLDAKYAKRAAKLKQRFQAEADAERERTKVAIDTIVSRAEKSESSFDQESDEASSGQTSSEEDPAPREHGAQRPSTRDSYGWYNMAYQWVEDLWTKHTWPGDEGEKQLHKIKGQSTARAVPKALEAKPKADDFELKEVPESYRADFPTVKAFKAGCPQAYERIKAEMRNRYATGEGSNESSMPGEVRK